MKNWFAVTVTGRVDKYGVDMTRRIAVESCCARIVDFQMITEPEHREVRQQFDRVVNLDRLLGI
jgi:hypothetical protein